MPSDFHTHRKGMLLVILAFSMVGASTQSVCPDCCKCQENNNDVHISCSCIPLAVPNKTSHFVMHEEHVYELGRHLQFYHPSWKNLKYLYLHGNDRRRTMYTSNNTFVNVPDLEELHLVGYDNLVVAPGGFSHLRKLKVLDFSQNPRLCLKCMSPLLHVLQHLPVETLNLSRTNDYARGIDVTDLDSEFVMTLLSFKNLDISWIGRIFIDFSTDDEADIRNYRFPNIEVLNISMTFVSHAHIKHADVFNNMFVKLNLVFPRLRSFVWEGLSFGGSLAMLDRECSEKFTNFDYNQFCKNSGNVVFLPPSLESIDLDNSLFLSGMCLEWRKPNTICLNSNNTLKRVSGMSMGVKGINVMVKLDHLNIVDSRNNKISVITENSLQFFPNLMKLLLGGNELGHYQYNVSFENFLKYSTELQIIDLSNNKLSYIPRRIFENNHKLEMIDLSDNQLNTISFKMKHLKQLKTIDMSTNRIIALSESIMNNLRTIILTVNASIDFSNNELSCSCHSRRFIGGLHDLSEYLVNFEQYKCLHKREIIRLDTIDESILQNDCIMAILQIVLPVSGSIIFSVLVGVTLYRKRILFIKLYVSCRFWRYRNKLLNVEDRVFLAYSHHDKDLVLSRIYPELNQKLQGLLHTDNDVLYINDKDFAFPGVIDEEIVTAVLSCKCTLVLISRMFLRSGWTNLEVSYSWTKKRKIFIVLLEDIKENELHGILRYLYNRDVRLVWPRHENEEDNFWANLLKGIVNVLDPRHRHRAY